MLKKKDKKCNHLIKNFLMKNNILNKNILNKIFNFIFLLEFKYNKYKIS